MQRTLHYADVQTGSETKNYFQQPFLILTLCDVIYIIFVQCHPTLALTLVSTPQSQSLVLVLIMYSGLLWSSPQLWWFTTLVLQPLCWVNTYYEAIFTVKRTHISLGQRSEMKLPEMGIVSKMIYGFLKNVLLTLPILKTWQEVKKNLFWCNV